MSSCKAFLSLVVLLLASVPLALAQGTYTQIDVPGAIDTASLGVDTAGDISGTYQDGSFKYHGFFLSGGIYTSIDYPSAIGGTYGNGLNDLGQVVGYTETGIGYVYDVSTQTYSATTCNGFIAEPISINNAGVMAGIISENVQYVLGFELVGSTCRTIAPVKTLETYVYGISASRELAGFIRNATAEVVGNFSYAHGQPRRVVIHNAPGAVVQGINPAGDLLVGYYSPSSGVTAGFFYQNGSLTTLQFPGSNNTGAFTMNSVGEVVGYFSDSSGVQHGFTWTPPADAAKK